MADKGKILIVEDDESITRVLQSILTANGFSVVIAQTGEQALCMIPSHLPDIVLLDLGLPGQDGLSVLRSIRSWFGKPVLVVSARDKEGDKVEALDLGADDYITKPFGTQELLARVRAAMRSLSRIHAGEELPPPLYRSGGLTIDFDKRLILVDGEPVHLTQNEYRIVELLARRAGSVMTYETLLREIWGPGLAGGNRILRVNMANIRRKLEQNPAEPRYILTEIGVGYRMAEEDNP